jgi:myo-inositol-1(or 4)-monophosphatase
VNWLYESKLALKAINRACEIFGTNPTPGTSWVKESSRDVATDLDVLLEKELCRVLAESGVPILAEETQSDVSGDPLWAVDPLDGTVNYLHGIPYFGTSVGFVAGGDCVAGAVVLPALQELYFTYGSEGAFLNGKKLLPQKSDSMLFGAAFGGKMEEPDSSKAYELFGKANSHSQGCVRLGSATALTCLVAKGSLQGAYGLGVKIWDVAGGLAICQHVGYEVVIRRHTDNRKVDFFVGERTAVDVLRHLHEKTGFRN